MGTLMVRTTQSDSKINLPQLSIGNKKWCYQLF
jgi:hypothetical protein